MDNQDVTTNEIMEFLRDHMVMKDEFDSRINRQKLELLDGVDEKLGSLKGDLVVMMRSEDKKVMLHIQMLQQKKILDDTDVNALLALQPFPQIMRS